MQSIEGLAASRAARAEHEHTRKAQRYEAALLAMISNRPREHHDAPITDQEHLTAAQFTATCDAFEKAQRGATPKANGEHVPPVAETAPVPKPKRSYRRKKSAKKPAVEG